MEVTWKTLTVLALTIVLGSGCLAEDLKCEESNACYCKLTNGSVINLQPLGLEDGNPRFTASVGKDGLNYTILYNPCKPIKEIGECKDAAACLEEPSPIGRAPSTINLAKHDNVKWTFEGNKPNLTYLYNNLPFNVVLECKDDLKPGDSNMTVKDLTNSTATVTVFSKCACPDGCPFASPEPEKQSSGLSTGSIIVIIFFCTVIMYLVVGMIYKKLVHGATGKELLPNVEFWTALPRLILDGVAFTCNCCRKKSHGTGYDNV